MTPPAADASTVLRNAHGDVVGSRPGTAEVISAEGHAEPPGAGPFRITARWSPPSASGRRNVRLTVEHRGEHEVAAAIRFRVDLAAGPDQPWWLVPGAFYGENRPADCLRSFPRFAVGAADHAAMVNNHWEFRADRAATPAVFGWAGRASGPTRPPASSRRGCC